MAKRWPNGCGASRCQPTKSATWRQDWIRFEKQVGNPWRAAASSFLLFAVGAIVPVLPFVFAKGAFAIAA